MRRRAGVGGIAHNDALTAKMRALGAERQLELREDAARQLAKFSSALETFAQSHRSAIKADPEFRAAFHAMCATTGVDPLASRKSAWGQILGLSEWYAELAVSVADRCLASRAHDGGVCALDSLVERVNASRGRAAGVVSADDVERAIEALSSLGGGWRVETTTSSSSSSSSKGTKIVRSVPIELSDDVNTTLSRARDAERGCLNASSLASAERWTLNRAADALTAAVKLGVALIDDQARDIGERVYWFPAFADIDLAS
jgi:ESCRT-II complex subunit VPS22